MTWFGRVPRQQIHSQNVIAVRESLEVVHDHGLVVGNGDARLRRSVEGDGSQQWDGNFTDGEPNKLDSRSCERDGEITGVLGEARVVSGRSHISRVGMLSPTSGTKVTDPTVPVVYRIFCLNERNA